VRRKPIGRHIVADPLICHGKLTFKGTRILVSDVLELVADGMDWDEIIHECHDSITRPAIAEAIRLAGRAVTDHGARYLRKEPAA
jgi:uncharacterized protein (DUF433 family)